MFVIDITFANYNVVIYYDLWKNHCNHHYKSRNKADSYGRYI